MTTSWSSSTEASNRESVSSSSTDKNEQRKANNEQICSSSEGSIFSDSDHQQDESNTSPLVNFERGPSFLIPNV
jgi:hypothetical protein